MSESETPLPAPHPADQSSDPVTDQSPASEQPAPEQAAPEQDASAPAAPEPSASEPTEPAEPAVPEQQASAPAETEPVEVTPTDARADGTAHTGAGRPVVLGSLTPPHGLRDLSPDPSARTPVGRLVLERPTGRSPV